MQKDLKIGMAVGLALVTGIFLWLATRPSLSPQARILQPLDTGSGPQSPNIPPSSVAQKSQLPNSGVGQNDNETAGDVAIEVDASSSKATDVLETEQTAIQDLTVHEQAEKIKTERFHIVLKGQTLSEISYKYYGSTSKWKKIFDANRETIKDANKLIPGTKLIIPD